jgi:hypothetical protein
MLTSGLSVGTGSADATITTKQSALAAGATHWGFTAATAIEASPARSTGAESSRASTCTTSAHGIRAAIHTGTAVAGNSAVPTRVASRATVETIATVSDESAGVAAVTWFSARASQAVKAESVATKHACVGMFCCTIRE